MATVLRSRDLYVPIAGRVPTCRAPAPVIAVRIAAITERSFARFRTEGNPSSTTGDAALRKGWVARSLRPVSHDALPARALDARAVPEPDRASAREVRGSPRGSTVCGVDPTTSRSCRDGAGASEKVGPPGPRPVRGEPSATRASGSRGPCRSGGASGVGEQSLAFRTSRTAFGARARRHGAHGARWACSTPVERSPPRPLHSTWGSASFGLALGNSECQPATRPSATARCLQVGGDRRSRTLAAAPGRRRERPQPPHATPRRSRKPQATSVARSAGRTETQPQGGHVGHRRQSQAPRGPRPRHDR